MACHSFRGPTNFYLYMPEGWNDQDIEIFINSCWKNIEQLIDPNIDETSKWQLIAETGIEKTLNPELFTLTSCLEVAFCIRQYVRRYAHKYKNKYFQKCFCNVTSLLKYFPQILRNKEGTIKLREKRPGPSKYGESSINCCFMREEVIEGSSKLVKKRRGLLGKVLRYPLFQFNLPNFDDYSTLRFNSNLSFKERLTMKLILLRKIINSRSRVSQTKESVGKQKFFTEEKAENKVKISVQDESTLNPVPELCIIKGSETQDLLQRKLLPDGSFSSIDEKGLTFSIPSVNPNIPVESAALGKDVVNSMYDPNIDSAKTHAGPGSPTNYRRSKNKGQEEACPVPLKTRKVLKGAALAHSLNKAGQVTSICDRDLKLIGSSEPSRKVTAAQRRVWQTKERTNKQSFVPDKIDKNRVKTSLLAKSRLNPVVKLRIMKKSEVDAWVEGKPLASGYLSSIDDKGLTFSVPSDNPNIPVESDVLGKDVVNSIYDPNIDSAKTHAGPISPTSYRRSENKGQEEACPVLLNTRKVPKGATVARSLNKAEQVTSICDGDSELIGSSPPSRKVTVAQKRVRLTKERTNKQSFVADKIGKNKVKTSLLAKSKLNAVVKLRIMKKSEVDAWVQGKPLASSYLSRNDEKGLTFSVPSGNPNIPVKSDVLGKDVVNSIYDPNIDSAETHTGPGLPTSYRRPENKGQEGACPVPLKTRTVLKGATVARSLNKAGQVTSICDGGLESKGSSLPCGNVTTAQRRVRQTGESVGKQNFDVVSENVTVPSLSTQILGMSQPSTSGSQLYNSQAGKSLQDQKNHGLPSHSNPESFHNFVSSFHKEQHSKLDEMLSRYGLQTSIQDDCTLRRSENRGQEGPAPLTTQKLQKGTSVPCSPNTEGQVTFICDGGLESTGSNQTFGKVTTAERRDRQTKESVSKQNFDVVSENGTVPSLSTQLSGSSQPSTSSSQLYNSQAGTSLQEQNSQGLPSHSTPKWLDNFTTNFHKNQRSNMEQMLAMHERLVRTENEKRNLVIEILKHIDEME